jgi:phage shock protein A
MNEHEWQEVIGTIGIFVLLIAVVVIVLWQTASGRRAKAQLAHESEYRKLADAAAAREQRIEQQLAEIGGQVADLRDRTDTIERVLKDVE